MYPSRFVSRCKLCETLRFFLRNFAKLCETLHFKPIDPAQQVAVSDVGADASISIDPVPDLMVDIRDPRPTAARTAFLGEARGRRKKHFLQVLETSVATDHQPALANIEGRNFLLWKESA